MRISHEALPLEDAPTPEQLFRLAGKSAVLAKQHDRLKVNRNRPDSRTRFMMPIAEVIVPDLFEAPFGYRFEDRYAARVERTDFRSWSMRIFHNYVVTDMGSQRGVERHTYSFEWGRQEATLSHHRLAVLPMPETDIYDEINNFSAPDDMAAEWGWRTQFQTMSSGDVELLICDIDAFTSR